MKVFAMSTIASLALICTFGSSAYAQDLLYNCNMQCWQVYNIRFAYCYDRHGGNTYEAELCMINEYDVLVDCQRNCEQTYGMQATSNLQAVSLCGVAEILGDLTPGIEEVANIDHR